MASTTRDGHGQHTNPRGVKPRRDTDSVPTGRTPALPTRDAAPAARAIFDHYRAYRREFAAITAAARWRFLGADWRGAQEASATRLQIYERYIDAILNTIDVPPADNAPANATFWPDAKRRYGRLIAARTDGELAETVFNSVYRRAVGNAHRDDGHLFVHSSFAHAPPPPEDSVFTTYSAAGGLRAMIRRLLRERVGDVEWGDFEGDVANIVASLAEMGIGIGGDREIEIDAVNSVFYRNKGAYIVGRLRQKEQPPKPSQRTGTAAGRGVGQHRPIALSLGLTESRTVYVDTLLCDEDELSIVFSFTRAYFMVSTSHPFGLVEFLHGLLPNKKRSEIYASIGEHRHGKTEFYRDFLRHLDRSNDQFVIAPGIKGTVMTVFTLPSYQTVFKIIKDRFAPQKEVTAKDVRDRYHMVKGHDRAGRMADTQEFENLALPQDRLTPTLLAELQTVAGSSIAVDGRTVRIAHLYTERLMTPLNLHVESVTGGALIDALDEYGNAIKQLAAANIFPGDMLLKNFGVTRHGRVVFYDYDEICYLTDLNFRAIPAARNAEEEMAAEPWYSVAPNDVFPEEFRRFLFGKPQTKRLFERLHGDLFDPRYWRRLQGAIREGQVLDVYPYRRKKRFSRLTNQPAIQAETTR